MFYSRKINNETNKVEVWECEWSNKGAGMARKVYLRNSVMKATLGVSFAFLFAFITGLVNDSFV